MFCFSEEKTVQDLSLLTEPFWGLQQILQQIRQKRRISKYTFVEYTVLCMFQMIYDMAFCRLFLYSIFQQISIYKNIKIDEGGQISDGRKKVFEVV